MGFRRPVNARNGEDSVCHLRCKFGPLQVLCNPIGEALEKRSGFGGVAAKAMRQKDEICCSCLLAACEQRLQLLRSDGCAPRVKFKFVKR